MTEKEKIIKYVEDNIDSLKGQTTRGIAKSLVGEFSITEATIINYVNQALKPFRPKVVKVDNHYGIKLQGAKVEVKGDKGTKRGKVIEVFKEYFLVQFAEYKEAYTRSDITAESNYLIKIKTSQGWKDLKLKTSKLFNLKELEL